MTDKTIPVHIEKKAAILNEEPVCQAYMCKTLSQWTVSWNPGQFHDTQLLPMGASFCDRHFHCLLASEFIATPLNPQTPK